MHDILVSQDYRLVEDAWSEHGRRTYVHDDDADRQHLANLTKAVRSAGWQCAEDQLRTFRRPATDEIIEIEPGGSDTSGHFLHHMKVRDS